MRPLAVDADADAAPRGSDTKWLMPSVLVAGHHLPSPLTLPVLASTCEMQLPCSAISIDDEGISTKSEEEASLLLLLSLSVKLSDWVHNKFPFCILNEATCPVIWK